MTSDEIHDAYIENASYAADNSVAKARAFETACVRKLADPTSHSVDGESTAVDPKMIESQLTQVRRWIAANARSRSAKDRDFRRLRD